MAMGPAVPAAKSIFAKIGAWFATSKIAKALSWAVTAITVGAGIKGFREAQDLMAKGQGILGQKNCSRWKDTSHIWKKKSWQHISINAYT